MRAIERDTGRELLEVSLSDNKAGVRHDDSRACTIAPRQPGTFVAHDLAVFIDVDLLTEIVNVVHRPTVGEEVARDLLELAVLGFALLDHARPDVSRASIDLHPNLAHGVLDRYPELLELLAFARIHAAGVGKVELPAWLQDEVGIAADGFELAILQGKLVSELGLLFLRQGCIPGNEGEDQQAEGRKSGAHGFSFGNELCATR